MYSVILTRGLENIKNEIDMEMNYLLTEHGYAAQELINIMLIGRASSNVTNGDQDMGEGLILHGIHKQSEIGFLTLFEAYEYFVVGDFYKTPKLPIWIVCSESHYSVIFSAEFDILSKKKKVFDLVYYDELARQEDDIVLTVKMG